jgi:hypothetical protein
MDRAQEGTVIKRREKQVLKTVSVAGHVELRAKYRTRNLISAYSGQDHHESMYPDAWISPGGRITSIEATGKTTNSLSRRFINRRWWLCG